MLELPARCRCARGAACARALTRRDRSTPPQEKLYKAIEAKKAAAVAEVARQAEASAASAAAAAEGGATVKRNVYGDEVVVRPHISPRTKRLTKQHLKTEEFAGNYGQRLYQYGVTDFHKVRRCTVPSARAGAFFRFPLTARFSLPQKRDEKVVKLKGTVDLSAMSETRPLFQTVKLDDGEEEKVLVGTFLPNLELTKGYKAKKPADEKPFWERLHVED